MGGPEGDLTLWCGLDMLLNPIQAELKKEETMEKQVQILASDAGGTMTDRHDER